MTWNFPSRTNRVHNYSVSGCCSAKKTFGLSNPILSSLYYKLTFFIYFYCITLKYYFALISLNHLKIHLITNFYIKLQSVEGTHISVWKTKCTNNMVQTTFYVCILIVSRIVWTWRKIPGLDVALSVPGYYEPKADNLDKDGCGSFRTINSLSLFPFLMLVSGFWI